MNKSKDLHKLEQEPRPDDPLNIIVRRRRSRTPLEEGRVLGILVPLDIIGPGAKLQTQTSQNRGYAPRGAVGCSGARQQRRLTHL